MLSFSHMLTGSIFEYHYNLLLFVPAGPLALASKWLTESEEPFFVLNSDVICAFPFEQLKAAHAKNGGEATIAVSKMPSLPRVSSF